MTSKYCIYMHKNKSNGKIYIGMTNNPQCRWRKGGIEYKPKENRNSRFWGAIQKYGWENFEHIILLDGLTQKEAEKAEIQTIAKYNSTDRDIGYNLAKGGNGGRIYSVHPRGMLGKHQSNYEIETHRKLLSNPKTNPMKNGQVIWDVTNPHPRGMLGKHQSEKHKAKMAQFRGKNAFNHRSFTIYWSNGQESYFESVRSFLNKYKAWQVYKMLKSNEPYKLPTQNMPNRDKYAQFVGCIFKYDDEI